MVEEPKIERLAIHLYREWIGPGRGVKRDWSHLPEQTRHRWRCVALEVGRLGCISNPEALEFRSPVLDG